jgi:5'-AMP-activated protein kinase regulatory gamma subunit
LRRHKNNVVVVGYSSIFSLRHSMFTGKRGSLRKALYRHRDRPNSGGSVDIPLSRPPTICEPNSEQSLKDPKNARRKSEKLERPPQQENVHQRGKTDCNAPLSVETTHPCTCPGALSADPGKTSTTVPCQAHDNERHQRSISASPHGCYLTKPQNNSCPLNAPLLIPLQGTASSSSNSSVRGSGSRLSSSMYLATRLTHHPTVVDFEDWHTGLDHKSQEAVYSLFMKAHKCYDLIPNSSKLVVFDTELPVSKAFYALVYNGVRAAPLWDNKKQEFVGMLTITDFIQILHRYYMKNIGEGFSELEQHKISTWRDVFEADGRAKTLVTIDPSESLFRAVQILCDSKIHRLPVMDHSTGDIFYILTHKRLIKFLYLYLNDLPKPSFMDKTPKELNIGSWGDICTISKDTLLIDALKIFLEKRVSALPLLDADGQVVDIYAKFDAINLAADKSYNNLDVTVHEALKHRSDWFEGVRKCSERDSLMVVIDILVKAEVHRLIVTNDEQRVVGIISLSDILKHIVLDPPKLDDGEVVDSGDTAHSYEDGVRTQRSSSSFDILDKHAETEVDSMMEIDTSP